MKIYFPAAVLFAALLAANASQAVISAGPSNLTINAGSTANFTVTAANATTFQWTFQGPGMLQATNITGATNSAYAIPNTSTNQAGTYSVIVGGSTGTSLTNSATLTVLQGTIMNFQISGFATGPSNVLVELFDHDKPATVQNFIHYVYSGAYSNLFFDRLLPGFVLQGGGWFAQDQTNSTPPFTVGQVFSSYQQIVYPELPSHVDSEFYVGPQVSNLKGTLAMALPPGYADGATSDFFFNLVDNTNLDTTNTGNGPFTVFGRVLSGSEVLDYFNNTNVFRKPSFTTIGTNDIFTNGIFDFDFYDSSANYLTDLPLNYHATNFPADTSLFFVEFSCPDTNALPVVDTNIPTVAITFPSANGIMTNGIPVTAQGTASDPFGLALIYFTLTGGGNFLPEVVFGTTDWSAPLGVLPIGSYNLILTPVNGAGYQGDMVIQSMLVSAVFTNGLGAVSATDISTGGVISDAVGANLASGTDYTLTALPNPGQYFSNWTSGTNILSTNINLNISMSDTFFVTANFSSNNCIAFTYPSPGGNTTNGTFSIRGVITGLTNTPVTVKCQLYSYTNLSSVGKLMVTNGHTNWSFPVAGLPLGHYVALVSATNNSGQLTVITNNFTAGLPIAVLTNGNGRGAITASFTAQTLVPGQTNYVAEGQACTLRATPASGSIFESWFNGSIYTNSPYYRFVMLPGLASPVATFVSNDFPASVSSPILFSYPASGARLTNGSFTLAGTISPAVTNPVVGFQLFYGSNSASPLSTNVTITNGATKTARSTWAIPLSNLTPGYYTVVATVSDAKGRSTLISENFQVMAQLVLQVIPPGSGRLTSNWTGQYVPVGTSCSITETTNGGHVFAYWSNSLTATETNINPLKFTVTTNLSITANFVSNYFFGIAGNYYGLFYPGGQNVTSSNSGYYSLAVTSNGGMSLKLGFPSFTNTVSGNFPLYNPSGYVGYSVSWNDGNGLLVTNSASLILTNGALGGYVAGPGFYSTLQAFRAATKLTSNSPIIPGTNVFIIPGNRGADPSQPGGDGYASFILRSNGAVSLIGYLADNTSFSESTFVATNFIATNAVWPFYSPLFGGKGIILGWMTNTSPSSFLGTLAWSKPPKIGSYYTNGIYTFITNNNTVVTNNYMVITNASSAPFVPPVKGTQYQIAFGGSSLTNGLTNTLNVAANGLFTNVSGGQIAKLLVTLNPKTGALTGSFAPPPGTRTNNLYGAFTSPVVGGSGYFLDTNSQTGFFQITIVH